MPTTTPNFGFPIPLDNDPVFEGAKIIRDGLTAVDRKLKDLPAGSVNGGSAPAPGTYVIRDAQGRAQVVGPRFDQDIATKGYVDSVVPGAVTVHGTVATALDLPPVDRINVGVAYVTEDNGHLFVRLPSGWTDVGEFRGPQGPAGGVTPADLDAAVDTVAQSVAQLDASIPGRVAAGGLNVCKAVRTTAQLIPANADTPIQFNSAEFDVRPDGAAAQYSSTGIYARTRGIYLAVAQAPWAFNTSGARTVRVMKNSTSIAHTMLEPVQGGLKNLQATAMVEMDPGDQIRMVVWHSANASLNVLGNTNVGSGDGRASLSVTLLARL